MTATPDLEIICLSGLHHLARARRLTPAPALANPLPLQTTLLGAAALLLASAAGLAAAQADAVIALSQITWQIVESENDVDGGHKTARNADCEAINYM